MNIHANAIQPGDGALIIVDVQNDFLPGGALAVTGGDLIIPVLNRYIGRFSNQALQTFATRCWHPEDHCSFRDRGGPWPKHCVAGSHGAAFASNLKLPKDVEVISKATTLEKDAYSGFDGTELAQRLHRLKIQHVFIGGLATDYCVLHTVKDALKEGFEVLVLHDAVRAVNVRPDDGDKALTQMQQHGAILVKFDEF